MEIRFGCYEVLEKNSTSVTLRTDGGKIKVLTHQEYKKLTAKVAIEAQEKQAKAMRFVYEGKVTTLYDWALQYNIPPCVALKRIEAGQTIEECLLNKRAKYLYSTTTKFIAHINDGNGNALCKPSSSKKWCGVNSASYICGACKKKFSKLSIKQ